jgi:glycosyltransferase involved in cell wall biosynthesis
VRPAGPGALDEYGWVWNGNGRTRLVHGAVDLGEVGERKGVDVLLEALADLSRRGLAWRAVIAGNGAVAKAAARAGELAIADRISFPGWVGEADADALLRRADIFVLPSRAENQPVAIIEAMARAVPVVASGISGIPDQVIDGETGLLVAPGDMVGLADALATLAAAPELRERYGRAGLLRFEDRFSVIACTERFVALYRAMHLRKKEPDHADPA